MRSDTGIQEQLLLASRPSREARAAADDVLARERHWTIHDYGPSVQIIEASDQEAAELGDRLPGDVRATSASAADEHGIPSLSETEHLGIRALRLRETAQYQQAKAARPLQGEVWDTERANTPGCLISTSEEAHAMGAPKAEAGLFGTSTRLSGSVAVGLIIVEGPTGDLQFSEEERTKVVAETQAGLTWLGGQHPSRAVTWRWDIHTVRIDEAADPDTDDLEALWRNPVMEELGYSANFSGVRKYVEDLREDRNTDWAFCAFFTKYPLGHFAYASIGGPRLVMDYNNDGWGPDNIDRVFAHETGHIFGAPDEYAASGCNCGGSWGYYDKPNKNCANCAPDGGVQCIMRSNSWEMCAHTPWHLGFPMCPGPSGVQFRGTVPANSSRRWFTHSWPADCHVVWTVVPTTPRSGGPQIRWTVQVERATRGFITYWITIRNLTGESVGVEARFDVLGST